MASRVTFVTGTAEVKRREHRDNGFEQNLELSAQPKVTIIDGKCTCCPYGYHIDLDFLRYCEAMSSGGTLKQLKRIQRSKRKLRKSMEIMLQQQGQITEDGGTPPPDVVNSTEASRLMNMVEYEQSSTHKILDDIDSNVDATIASIDYMMTSAKKSRNISSDSDDSPLSPNTPRYNTFPLNQTPNGDESSHFATSLSTSGRSDSMSSLSSVSTVSSENPQGTLMSVGPYGRQLITTTATAEVSGSTKYMTVTSAQIAATLATHLPPSEGNLSPQGSTTNISKTSLHAIREAMAMSLQRMRELEEQVKAIPILQVRISVLKEEKRLLMLQQRAKSSALKLNTRSVGTGQDSVLPPFSDKMTAMEKITYTTMTLPSPRAFDFPSNISPRSTSTPRSPEFKSPPPTMPKPKVRSTGVGEHSVIEPYLLQPMLPTGYTVYENEVQTELRSTTLERETLVLNRSRLQSQSDRIEEQLSPQPQTHITINQIQRGGPKALTRSVGIGDGNVFDTGLHIHEKELRTVIIGQTGQVGKRNVGIECRPATRDVGVHFCCDDEKPSTRTVGVNVNTSSLISSVNFKEEELRVALQDALHKNVRSMGTNCNFRPLTNDASTMYQKIQCINVGVGEDCRTDVDIRPHMIKKSIGVNVRPEITNRSMNTEKGWLLDQSTNTPVVEKRTKATTTERPRQSSSSTFMEKTINRNIGSQTDVRTFLATDQLKNIGCNTVRKHMLNVGVNTDVKRLVSENFDFELTFKEGSTNTTFSVADKCINTDKDRYSDQKPKKSKTVGVSNDRTDSFVCTFDGIDRSSQTKKIAEQDQFSSETVTVENVQRTMSDISMQRTMPDTSMQRTVPDTSVQRTMPDTSVQRTMPDTSAQNRLSSEAYVGVDMNQFMTGQTVTLGSKARKSGKRNSGEFKRASGDFNRNSGELNRNSGEFNRNSGEFNKSDNEEYHFTEETYIIHGNIEDLQKGDAQMEKIKSSERVVTGSSAKKISDFSTFSSESFDEPKKSVQEKVQFFQKSDNLSQNNSNDMYEQSSMRRSSGEGSSTEFGSGAFQAKVVEERISLRNDGDGYSQFEQSGNKLYSEKSRDQETFQTENNDRYATSSHLDQFSQLRSEGSSVDGNLYSFERYGSSIDSTKGRSDVDVGKYSTDATIGGSSYSSSGGSVYTGVGGSHRKRSNLDVGRYSTDSVGDDNAISGSGRIMYASGDTVKQVTSIDGGRYSADSRSDGDTTRSTGGYSHSSSGGSSYTSVDNTVKESVNTDSGRYSAGSRSDDDTTKSTGGYSYSSSGGSSYTSVDNTVKESVNTDSGRYSVTSSSDAITSSISGGNLSGYSVDGSNVFSVSTDSGFGETSGTHAYTDSNRRSDGSAEMDVSVKRLSGEGSPGLRSEGGFQTRLVEENIIRRGVSSLQSISDGTDFQPGTEDSVNQVIVKTNRTVLGSHGVPFSSFAEHGTTDSSKSTTEVTHSQSSGNWKSDGGYLMTHSDSLIKDLESQIRQDKSRTIIGTDFPDSESSVREEKSVTETIDESGRTVTTVTTRTIRNGEVVSVKESRTVSDAGSSSTVIQNPSVAMDMSIDSVDIEKLNRTSLLKSELNQMASDMKLKKHSRKQKGDHFQSEVTTSSYDDSNLEDGERVEFSESHQEYMSSVDGGSLKSCMKQSKSVEVPGKKGISFASTVVGGTDSSSSDATSASDSEGETDSYEEGSYDGRQGNIVYQCKDDEAIAQGIPGAKMFDQNIRETYELNSEVQSACEVLAQYLVDSTTIQTKQLNASVNVIQQDWFKITNNKLVDPHQVEDYISSFNEISKKLMEHIVNMADANGNTALHYSVSNCNFEVVGLLLDTGICDLNKQNKAGYTAIMLASLASIQTNSQEEVVCRLFSEGDINLRAVPTGQTAMMLAVSHGRTNMVKLLLENGASVNEQDDDGSTALMCACEHGHSDIVKLLLAHPSCDATLTDDDGSTALTIAMEAGHRDIGVILYAHLNFAKGPNSPGLARKRRTSSSPTPSRIIR